MRGDQLIRQWKIIRYLAGCTKGKTVAQIIEHFDFNCSSRTIYRDLEVISFSGIPIYNYSEFNNIDNVKKWAILKDHLF